LNWEKKTTLFESKKGEKKKKKDGGCTARAEFVDVNLYCMRLQRCLFLWPPLAASSLWLLHVLIPLSCP